MNDTNERSVASAGSVADEPDAWMHISGGLSLGVFKHVDPRLRHLCVPLYRQPKPTLTAAEREAVKRAAGFVEELAHPETSLTAATLRELLERLK